MADTFVPSMTLKPSPDSVYIVTYTTVYGAAPSFTTASVLVASNLPVLAYEGQVFKGWYYDPAFTDKAEVGDAITAATVLYARWAPEPSATFDLAALSLSVGKHKITVRARGEGFADSEASEAVEYTVGANTYNITTALSNCFGYSTNPTEIDEGESVTLQFTPNVGYALPVSVYVTGAEYEWYYTSGGLVLSNPTGPVYISISCAQTAQLISFSIGGVAYQAEENMTFGVWVESEYNTGGFYADGNGIFTASGYPIDNYDDNPDDSFFTDPYVTVSTYIVDGGVYGGTLVPDPE